MNSASTAIASATASAQKKKRDLLYDAFIKFPSMLKVSRAGSPHAQITPPPSPPDVRLLRRQVYKAMGLDRPRFYEDVPV